jgi:hypothetical protein
MKDEMAFRFNHSHGQQLSCSLQAEPISIGCEAWIDVNRFCATEKSRHQATKTLRISEDRCRSAPSHHSLTKSFADLYRKFRRGSAKGLD